MADGPEKRREKMGYKLTVLLEDGTVGIASSVHEDIIGQVWTVELKDENGNRIEEIGVIAEILSSEEE
jgi:D-mannonate dehydratase